VNSSDDVKYRLDLAKGFLKEAEEDYAKSALDAALKCHKATEKVICNFNEWHSEEGT